MGKVGKKFQKERSVTRMPRRCGELGGGEGGGNRREKEPEISKKTDKNLL